MKTFIFSNCAKTSTAEYGRNLLRFVPTDSRLILLNRGEMYYRVNEFSKYQNRNFFLCCCGTHGLHTYFGLQELVWYGTGVNDVVLIDGHEDTASITIGRKDNTVETVAVDTPWVARYKMENPGKYPTTGYLSYYLAQKLYGVGPESVVLVNFYGNGDSSTGKWDGHAWDWEDRWLADKERIFI